MSKSGPSRRERRITAIMDHMDRPPYSLRTIERYGVFLVERNPSLGPDLRQRSVPIATSEVQRFEDKELAKFVLQRKNAEALADKLERLL